MSTTTIVFMEKWLKYGSFSVEKKRLFHAYGLYHITKVTDETWFRSNPSNKMITMSHLVKYKDTPVFNLKLTPQLPP